MQKKEEMQLTRTTKTIPIVKTATQPVKWKIKKATLEFGRFLKPRIIPICRRYFHYLLRAIIAYEEIVSCCKSCWQFINLTIPID